MPNEILTFDALASGLFGTDTGAPLNIGPGTVYRLTSFTIAAPQASVLYAGSVDTEGSLPASRKHENRTISMTIICDTAASLRALQAKAAKVAREAGTVKWNLPNGEVGFYDLYTTDTFEPTIDPVWQKNAGAYCTVNLSFTCAPYARAAEITLGDHTETTLPLIIFTETGIKGDVPAAARFVVDNDAASQSMMGLIWGLQCRYYSSASTANLYFEAESSGLTFATAAVGPAGASGAGSNTAKHTDIGTSASQSFSVGSTSTTHVGDFRVFARVRAPSTNTGIVSVQVQWAPMIVGATIANDWVPLVDEVGAALEDQWLMVDMGLVSLPQATIGTQGWTGSIFAKATVATDDLFYDYIVLVPAELSGQARAAQNVASGASFAVRSDGAFTSSGTAWGKANYEGDYIRLPVAGAEARTTRILAMMMGDFTVGGPGVYKSGAFDDVSARVFYTPRYLVVPSP